MANDELSGGDEQPVTITGTAENAKAGAIICPEEGRVIYVLGMREWDNEVVGTEVTLRGRLRRQQIFPRAKVNSRGVMMQGISGTPLVLELSEPFEKD